MSPIIPVTGQVGQRQPFSSTLHALFPVEQKSNSFFSFMQDVYDGHCAQVHIDRFFIITYFLSSGDICSIFFAISMNLSMTILIPFFDSPNFLYQYI